MKIIKHGRYYKDKINIVCKKCDCNYEIKKEDIKQYSKPKKVMITFIDDCWKEKYNFYTLCPECNHDNELEYLDYDTLTNEILESEVN